MPITSPGNDDDTGENHQPTLRKNTAEPVEQTLKQNKLDTAAGKPAGIRKLIRKYSAYTLLVLDEWLLDKPDERMRSFLLEAMEHRYDTASTVFRTQYPVKDRHGRLGGNVTADAIMDASSTTPSPSTPATTTCADTRRNRLKACDNQLTAHHRWPSDRRPPALNHNTHGLHPQ